jgi:hypothetical protein
LTETNGYNKLNITKKEVWNNETNSLEMTQTIKRLGLDITKVGVPFIVINTGKKEFPIIGDTSIIEYFRHVYEVIEGNTENI